MIFAVPRPSTPFNVGISSVQHFAANSSIESRPTLIRGKGNLSPYLPYSETAKLNVLVLFLKITQCEHNLNFVKKEEYSFGK